MKGTFGGDMKVEREIKENETFELYKKVDAGVTYVVAAVAETKDDGSSVKTGEEILMTVEEYRETFKEVVVALVTKEELPPAPDVLPKNPVDAESFRGLAAGEVIVETSFDVNTTFKVHLTTKEDTGEKIVILTAVDPETRVETGDVKSLSEREYSDFLEKVDFPAFSTLPEVVEDAVIANKLVKSVKVDTVLKVTKESTFKVHINEENNVVVVSEVRVEKSFEPNTQYKVHQTRKEDTGEKVVILTAVDPVTSDETGDIKTLSEKEYADFSDKVERTGNDPPPSITLLPEKVEDAKTTGTLTAFIELDTVLKVTQVLSDLEYKEMKNLTIVSKTIESKDIVVTPVAKLPTNRAKAQIVRASAAAKDVKVNTTFPVKTDTVYSAFQKGGQKIVEEREIKVNETFEIYKKIDEGVTYVVATVVETKDDGSSEATGEEIVMTIEEYTETFRETLLVIATVKEEEPLPSPTVLSVAELPTNKAEAQSVKASPAARDVKVKKKENLLENLIVVTNEDTGIEIEMSVKEYESFVEFVKQPPPPLKATSASSLMNSNKTARVLVPDPLKVKAPEKVSPTSIRLSGTAKAFHVVRD